MKSFLTSLFFCCLVGAVFAQTARVQVIHNSPTPTVDIYANDDLLLDNFAFRTAIPFVDLPADVEINIGVALANSTSSADVIANFPVTFEADKTYVVVAAGVVGDADRPFNLFVNDMGQETADSPDNISLLFFHGSPDAPEVDITTNDTPIFDNVSFGNFDGYLNVPATSYSLNVTPAEDNSTIVASYFADFDFWKGRTAVVIATGFLGGDAPAFEPWVVLDNGGTFPLQPLVVEPPVETDTIAKVQIIHNSPNAGDVDIYVNGGLLLDDFAFQTATPFTEVPVGETVSIAVAPGTSTSVDDAIATFDVVFEAGKRYYAVADGLVGFDFTVNLFDGAREAALNPGDVDVAVHHGSPDAPAVDVAARGIGQLIDSLAFGDFTDYLSIAPDVYTLDILPNAVATIVASFEADVTTLAGQSALIIASGLLEGEPGFGLIAVLADGTVITLPSVSTARLQVIHNSPTPTVDVYVNGDLLLDNFVFRTATPYITVPAGVELNIGIALDNSTSVDDVIANFPVTLDNGSTYVVVANGIVGNEATPFNLEVFDMAQERTNENLTTGIVFFHGSPDAPAVDISANGGVVFPNISFGEFSQYITIPSAPVELGVGVANEDPFIFYDANFNFWNGRTAVIFASGFLDGTPAFAPWVALDNGGTFPLPVVPQQAAPQVAEALAALTLNEVQLFPNPASDELNLQINLADETPVQATIFALNGQMVLSQNYGTLDQGVQQMRINTSNLKAGTYLVQLQTKSGAVSTTVIIK